MSFEGVEENLRFMVLEVTKQVEDTFKALHDPTPALIEKVEARDDYIDNQKSVIENRVFSRIHQAGPIDKRTIDRLRAINIVGNNLERVGDYCVNVVEQIKYLKDPDFLENYDYGAFFTEILEALGLVVDAILRQDIQLAFKICRAEFNLDALYKSAFDDILEQMKTGKNIENLVTTHLIFRYLERMGDSILNIGEAVIFAAVGEKFKIHQYEALKDTLRATGSEMPLTDVEFQSIWGTRSGCRIGRVQSPSGKKSQGALFKEGNKRKIVQEKDNIERWERIMPGLPPKIHAFMEEDDSYASLLVEYLNGCTLQDVVLAAQQDIIENAFFILRQTLWQLWEDTMKREPVPGQYIAQVAARLPDVLRLHPDYDYPDKTIGSLRIPGFSALLGAARAMDERLPAPFSVFIHGDCNINNIVYNHEDQRIHYIDLHRSRDADYLQDVSVFLVSNFRLPVVEEDIRTRINWMIANFLKFAREFAREHGDETFEARLTIGLVRSFITSTRFELNRKFAKAMFQRGVYLLERLAAFDRPLAEFRLPDHTLYY